MSVPQATVTGEPADSELAGGMPPEAVDQLLALYEQEALRLQRAARGVDVVGRALAGQRFIPKL